jgi:uncharacterized membrane protein
VIYFALKFIHILGAIVLLGTGAGIAFFMLMAHRSGDPRHIAKTAATVVVADVIFTASAVIAQPVSGYFLARMTGQALTEFWIAASLVLYVVAGLFWLPVIWIQVRMRDLAAAAGDGPLSATYGRLFRVWFTFGFPGFAAVLAVIWLMISKPVW